MTGALEGVDLANLKESELAAMLDVDARTVRRWLKTSSLPSHGYRSTKRFCWALVREWYVLYRVKIAQRGGAKVGNLDSEMRALRARAASAATQAAKEQSDRRAKRYRDRIAKLSSELHEERGKHRRPRLVRRRR